MKTKAKCTFLVMLIILIVFCGKVAYADSDPYSGLPVNNTSPLRVDPNLQRYREMFHDYFLDGYFEKRSNGVCLTLHPKYWAWSNQDKLNAWMSVYATFYRDWRWDNTEIMKQQFYCHARLIYRLIEREWNLEPWRTSMNPIDCN